MENINENVTEVTNEEVLNEEPKKAGFNYNDFKSIMDMIKSMDEQLKYLKDMSENLVRSNYGLKTSVLEDIIKYDKKDIETMELEPMVDFLSKYVMDENTLTDLKALSIDEVRAEMMEVKNSSLVLLSAKSGADKLKEESTTIFTEYMNYVTSDKAKEIKKKNLESLKQSLELEKDDRKKREMEEMIRVMESSMNYDFMYDRFRALGDKEVENIKNGFFSNRQGGYIMERFYKKMKMFGFKQDLYTYFLNIEETFLDEKYHPFNNLFLYIYARMIAYSDPYNKKDVMFANAINSGLASLVYHKFESTEQELNFKGIITGILDYFMEYREYFIENNTTYEKHPERIEYESGKEAALKKFYIEKLHSLDVTNFDETLPSKELKAIYEEKYNTLVSTQVEEYDQEQKATEEAAEEVMKPEIVEVKLNDAEPVEVVDEEETEEEKQQKTEE